MTQQGRSHTRNGEHGGHGGHAEHGGHGTGRGMFDPANMERLLGEQRRAKLPPEETLSTAGVTPGQTVVDLGCGPGYFTLPAAQLAGANGRVYAVDTQPEMLDACRRRAAGVGGIEFVHSDAAKVPLPDGTAGVVLISVMLHESKDRAAVLREAGRLLKPGGHVALIEFHKQDGPPGPPKEVRLSSQEVATVADAAGLRVSEQRDLGDLHVLYRLVPV